MTDKRWGWGEGFIISHKGLIDKSLWFLFESTSYQTARLWSLLFVQSSLLCSQRLQRKTPTAFMANCLYVKNRRICLFSGPQVKYDILLQSCLYHTFHGYSIKSWGQVLSVLYSFLIWVSVCCVCEGESENVHLLRLFGMENVSTVHKTIISFFFRCMSFWSPIFIKFQGNVLKLSLLWFFTCSAFFFFAFFWTLQHSNTNTN